jgi:putative FmdB family regulatory protein
MPLYEYECEACGHRFEVIQKFSDSPIGSCPKCGGPVHKLLSSPAIQFKGSGWYITDYARAGQPDSTNASAKTDAGTAAADKASAGDTRAETKSESKSESKPETKTKSETKPNASPKSD